MRLWMAGLAIFTPLAAARAEPGDQASVPFELSNGRIYVQAFVNGRGPYRFGFDTGASGTGRADTRLTTTLSLPAAGQAQNSDGVAVAASDLVLVDTLQLGPIVKRKIELVSRDYNKRLKPGDEPMMGIIARDFFSDFLVTIDYPARTIRFTGSSLDPKTAGVVAYGPSFAIPVCVGTVCHPGKVDTGSNRGLVLPKDMGLKVAVGMPRLLGEASRTNSSLSLHEIALGGPVRVGALEAKVPTALYTDPSTDTVNIGSDFLKDYVLTIDSKHGLLKIEAPATPGK